MARPVDVPPLCGWIKFLFLQGTGGEVPLVKLAESSWEQRRCFHGAFIHKFFLCHDCGITLYKIVCLSVCRLYK